MDEVTQNSSDLSEVDSTPLDLNDDLFDVKRELISVAGNWKNIGIALRLKRSQLEHIQTVNDGNPNACLTSVVMEWLNRKYDVKRFGEPTWQFLVEALSDPAGGVSMELARNIARRHKAKNRPNKAATSKNVRKRKAESGPNILARKKVNVGDASSTIPPQASDQKSHNIIQHEPRISAEVTFEG